jgi:hypothetical protein
LLVTYRCRERNTYTYVSHTQKSTRKESTSFSAPNVVKLVIWVVERLETHMVIDIRSTTSVIIVLKDTIVRWSDTEIMK